MDNPLPPREEYAKQVCFFLAELLRTRKISLKRASEIAEKVTQNINLVDSETQFLSLVKQLTLEFQELLNLGQRVGMHIQTNKRLLMEHQVREFVINSLVTNTSLALAVLQDAVLENCQVRELCVKFPQFEQFIQTKTWPNL